MCGIVGIIAGRAGTAHLVDQLVDRLAHRGPDDRGTWIDAEARVGLGHRRLAIVDLSPQGHQPMRSADGRWVISYNGEIYNHRALRAELEAEGLAPCGGWRGTSDTETLLEAIATQGLEAALERASGMFAFALWDRLERKLRLVRDRFGEKPLFYGWAGGDFLFASELKAIRAHPRFANGVSRAALRSFASRTHVPAPLSIYERLFKLPPAAILEVGAGVAAGPLDGAPREGVREGAVRLTRYWSYGDVLRRGADDPIHDEHAAIDALEHSLGEAIRGQSVADVPVGAFLSGGIDSSTVVALYQKHSAMPVRSFTIGFEDSHFDEAASARAVALHLGTVHEERTVTTAEAAAVIPLLPAMFDEPFGDSSQIPTFLVSSFARERVTVALSGDGGDELFAGYGRYEQALAMWRRLGRVPLGARRAGAAALRRIPFGVWAAADSLMGTSRRSPFSGKVYKGLGAAASVRTFDELYATYLDQWPDEDSPVLGAPAAERFPLDPGFASSNALRMTYCDALAYLPDDILCKVDRAAMAVSLETRVPFLDHRVAEVAARIPMSMKLRGGTGKWILRRLLGRHLPHELFDRPKTGFSMPIADWLRGDLRDWAEELLDPRRMREDGYFDTQRIQQRWRDNLSRRRNAASSIWAILMFQAWLRSPAGPAGVAQRTSRAA
jgi:asparagine synthase (glutamine-hydrolysing)